MAEANARNRQIVHEARIGDQARCCHRNAGWAVMATASGKGHINWTCLDCGCRTFHNGKHEPYADHPDRDSYPLLIPNERRYDVPFVHHAAHMQSSDWAARAEAAKACAGHRCQVCNGREGGLDAHHRTYERLGYELEADLTVLCRVCHELFSRHGRLVDWREDYVA